MKWFSRRPGRAWSRISWWAPYWFHVPRTWRGLKQAGRSNSIVRICLVSLVLGGAIVIGLKLAIPMIQLPPLWRLLTPFPTVLGYLVFMVVFQSLVPSLIEVRKDRIHVMTGQVNWVVKSEAVQRTRIVVYAADRIRLRVFYLRKDGMHSRVLGIARKVNLDELSSLLTVRPEVWDARERYRDPRPSPPNKPCP